MNPAGIKTSSQIFCLVQKLSGAVSNDQCPSLKKSRKSDVKLKEQFDGKLMVVDSYPYVDTFLNKCHLFSISHFSTAADT